MASTASPGVQTKILKRSHHWSPLDDVVVVAGDKGVLAGHVVRGQMLDVVDLAAAFDHELARRRSSAAVTGHSGVSTTFSIAALTAGKAAIKELAKTCKLPLWRPPATLLGRPPDGDRAPGQDGGLNSDGRM
jgi:hypothetical protein